MSARGHEEEEEEKGKEEMFFFSSRGHPCGCKDLVLPPGAGSGWITSQEKKSPKV